MEVTSKDIKCTQDSNVKPVLYTDEFGKEEDPILIMKLAKN